MIYELFLEGELADIRHDLGMQLNFNIDDINKYGSRDTSFSKTIILPGTARNNKLLGFVGELGSFNTFARGSANINDNFNPAQTTRAELRANGLLLLKGVFRLTGIVKDRDMIEYEGNLFGELGGFIAAIGNGKLEDLNFSQYDHEYTRDNIVNSWNTVNGSGYYYPLIDHGTYSVNKIDYDYRTFRPALFVKEYIDKIFAGSGYTYESSFFDSAFFKKLIIPSTVKEAQGLFSDLFIFRNGGSQFLETTLNPLTTNYIFSPSIEINRSFTGTGDPNITYTGTSTNVDIIFNITIKLKSFSGVSGAILKILKNSDVLFTDTFLAASQTFIVSGTIQSIILNTNDTININVEYERTDNSSYIKVNTFTITSLTPVLTAASLGDDIYIKDQIPRNIFQKDFFTWILKMFNLYVTENKIREKHLLIEPYKDYYDLSESEDWTYKVSRDKPWQIKPMGMLNGRFFEYKYKEDSDFYNDNYKKKYNLPYGSNLQDTGFQFAKEKQTIEIGFSPTVLVTYLNTDKVVPAIYKKTTGNSVEQEEKMAYNIRILIAKKITGVDFWTIRNTSGEPSQLGQPIDAYGYAGHFDDPVNPTVDINFGAASEIYFDPVTYPSNNLFNTYWSGYIAEIADKDSKLLTCHVYLTDLDVAQLDFSKPVFIDGVLWRINKVMDYDATSGELTKVELLKVINNG